jgi:TetR/AcrR family transcriptional repressor of mexJK operon
MSGPPPTTAPTLPDEEPRAIRKRKAILEAATTLFLRNGYLGTTMDEIAALAHVSKPTVYRAFSDKERLFSEIVTSEVAQAADPVYADVLELESTGEIEADLRGFAKRLLGRVMQPRILRLRRLVIGEAERFPELGRTFYEQGPARTVAALAAVFERLAGRGALKIDDPLLAAAHFNWLVMSIPLNQAMFLGEDEPPSSAELDRYADAGVRAFLAAYGRT